MTKCLQDAEASGFAVEMQGEVGVTATAQTSSDHAAQNVWVNASADGAFAVLLAGEPQPRQGRHETMPAR